MLKFAATNSSTICAYISMYQCRDSVQCLDPHAVGGGPADVRDVQSA